MTKPTLIIVSGLPATGKTTLAKVMAKHLKLPLISKDEIKEMLFDSVGHGDRVLGEKLNIPVYQLLAYFVERSLSSGHSVIVESLYDDDFPRKTFTQWQTRYNVTCIQILCRAESDILLNRFIARIGHPDRHPGHNDKAALEDFKKWIKNTSHVESLPLQGEVYELDTTDFSKMDTKSLLKNLENQIAKPIKDNRNHWNLRLLAKLWFRQKQPQKR